MESKKGVSHIEAVISFVIFIGFLIFAYFFFSPFESDRTLDSTLDYAYREVRDHAQMEVETYSVKITDPNVNGDVILTYNSLNSIMHPNASVENGRGTIIPSYVDSSHNIHFNLPNDDFVRIKYATYLINGMAPTGRVSLIPPQYSVSSYEKKEFYSMMRLVNLSEDYRKDYIGLKKRFNLPNRVDFDFNVVLNNGSIIKVEQNMPQNIEVKAKQDRIEIMKSDGSSSFGDLVVRVW